jgi:sugar/nucleoside kinase (ribokinase family)
VPLVSEKEAGDVARIVVVGSAAQDDVVTLVQPLRAGCHLDARSRRLRLGGGGANTAVPLRHAGHDVALVAPVGADAVGEWLLAKLQAAGIDVSAVARVPGDSTRSLVLVEPGGERTIVNLNRCREAGPPQRLSSLEADAIYARSRDLDLRELLADAAARCVVVAHVPPLAPGSRPVHVLVGSESDLPPEFLADPCAAGRAIAGETLRLVVVTRGPRGAEGFSASERVAVPAPVVPVVDSTAAGDVFAAGLVHGLALGRPTRALLEGAVAWGAAAVACPGVPSRETIESLL